MELPHLKNVDRRDVSEGTALMLSQPRRHMDLPSLNGLTGDPWESAPQAHGFALEALLPEKEAEVGPAGGLPVLHSHHDNRILQ